MSGAVVVNTTLKMAPYSYWEKDRLPPFQNSHLGLSSLTYRSSLLLLQPVSPSQIDRSIDLSSSSACNHRLSRRDQTTQPLFNSISCGWGFRPDTNLVAQEMDKRKEGKLGNE
ncbi:unnamed protein product [Ilex paraguariensis]|uniref:Uncharacterized protein n=1 Tax=Ilex paraguariensis TaxID=185542 RepID=A0ABC8TF88_9AQUA